MCKSLAPLFEKFLKRIKLRYVAFLEYKPCCKKCQLPNKMTWKFSLCFFLFILKILGASICTQFDL